MAEQSTKSAVSATSAKSGKSNVSSQVGIHHYKPTAVDVYFLAMTIALGGQYNRWADTLVVGFWGTIVSVCFNALGYFCFAMCMAEMAGTLPFSGGAYGFVRAFLGPYSGYIVSRFEIIMIICYVAALVQSLATFPTLAGVSAKEYEPAWWLFYYVMAVGIALLGCNFMEYWAFIRLIGFFSLSLLLIYILGSFASVDYDRYASGDKYNFEHEYYMERIYKTAGMFRGVQYLPLLSIKVADAKNDIPRGMMASMTSLCITSIAVIFAACTQYPGTTALINNTFPLTAGFMKIFNITALQALWLNFPALFGNFYGFVWAYGRQMSSMAKSGLMPEFIGWMTPVTDAPYVALILGTVLSFGLALLCFYDVLYVGFLDDVKYTYMFSSYIIYVFMFISYIIFKFRYSSLARSFTSPLGIPGAVVGLSIFVIDNISVLKLIAPRLVPLYTVLITTVVMSIYYFAVLHGKQQFSEEEKEKLFKAYLINANVKSRNAVKKRGMNKAAAANTRISQSQARSRQLSQSGVLSQSQSSDNTNPEASSKVGKTRDGKTSRSTDSSSVALPPATTAGRLMNNQVIPEASIDDENQFSGKFGGLKEDAIAEAERVPWGHEEEEGEGMVQPFNDGNQGTTTLLEGLSQKYNVVNLSGRVTNWIAGGLATHNAVKPDDIAPSNEGHTTNALEDIERGQPTIMKSEIIPVKSNNTATSHI